MNYSRFKFRAFVKNTGLLLGVDSFFIDPSMDKITLHFSDNHTKTMKPSDFVLEQCTGLKDKNGQLIYENDIIKISSNTDMEVIGPVVWDDEETGFCIKYKEELFRFNTYRKYHKLEVIGNIHTENINDM